MRDHDALDNNPHVTRAALEALHGQLYGWARSRCGYDDAAAEDVVQDAFVRAFRSLSSFRGDSTIDTRLRYFHIW